MKFSKFFKRRHPYAPVAFLGRKNVEKMLGADIKKLKNIKKKKKVDESAEAGEKSQVKKR